MMSDTAEVVWIGEGAARRKSMTPWIKDDIVFYPHQVEAIRKLARQRSFILADDMGLGKSLQALVIFAIDIVRGFCETAIIVCPTGLKANWEEEIKKFSGVPCMVLETLTPAKRKDKITEFKGWSGPKILIVNYEQVIPHKVELNAMRFDVAIFDEAHWLKNHKAARTKASLALYSRRSFLLTGTPMLNRPNELWTLLHRCNPKEFPNYWNFTHRYCQFGGFKNKQIVGVKNEMELRSHLAKYMTRRLKRDVLDLPEVQIIERRVDMLPEQKKLYEQVKSDMKLTRMDTSETDEIDNALTKFLRLKQICGTTQPFLEEDFSAKLDLALEDDLEILTNEDIVNPKIVVFTQFRAVHSAYVNRVNESREMHAAGVKVFEITGSTPIDQRQGVKNQWELYPGPAVLVCMLQVAGIGLNMTAARHGSFLDKLFVPGLNQQAVDRLHRIGASKTQPIQIREYICRGSIENRVNQILAIKQTLEADIIGKVGDDIDFKKKVLAAMMEDLNE
jgi:SNF2 family DNA or RNA helicase